MMILIFKIAFYNTTNDFKTTYIFRKNLKKVFAHQQ